MTDVRITGLTREVLRDGPGTVRVTKIAREVHRDPVTNPTRVRVVTLCREVMYKSHNPVTYPLEISIDVGVTPSVSRRTDKAISTVSVGVIPQAIKGTTLGAFIISVQAIPGHFKTFPRTFTVPVGVDITFALHHHVVNFIRGLIDRLGLRGIIDAILPTTRIRGFVTPVELAGVVETADASDLRGWVTVPEVKAFVEE